MASKIVPIISFVLASVVVGGILLLVITTPSVDCGVNEVKIHEGFEQRCVNYPETLNKTLNAMKNFDEPVSPNLLSQALPEITEKEIEAVLIRYREETGNVVEVFGSWRIVDERILFHYEELNPPNQDIRNTSNV